VFSITYPLVVKLENVWKRIGNTEILKGVSFSLPEKTVTGLLGPNGAGKTTTLKTIATLYGPDSGQVSVGGFDTVKSADEVRKIIGYLPETPPLYGELRVREYLDIAGRLRGFSGSALKESVEQATERCKLEEASSKLISKLSKGFQQRVGIAQAILHTPKVLILDEPTSGLDPLQLAEIRELIQELAEESTVLFSSHILPEIVETCSAVVLMLGGVVAWKGENAGVKELEERFRSGIVGAA
jgi:ABC-2 type transport system ATP-binding protein